MKRIYSLCLLAFLGLAVWPLPAAKTPAPARKPSAKTAATTAFTYQGRLTLNGPPTTGAYDFRVYLYDAATNGNIVSSTTVYNVAATNGLFSMPLNFGSVWDGGRYYLSLTVRRNGSGSAFTALSGRQEVTAAPYALGLAYPLASAAITSDAPAIDLDNAGVGGALFMTGTPSLATAYFASDAEGDALRADANETATGSAIMGLHYGSLGNSAYFENINDANTDPALFAVSNSTDANSYAGYFSGNVGITGTLSKAAGSFRIDHPLDPAGKYLNHSFVESPDMMNIYNGIATLDAAGKAEVALPDWFGALNKDFRYQLTAIGAPGPNLYIAQEVVKNRFKIAGGLPGQRVSWQVTGVRQDAYANAHRIPVEEVKPAAEQGTYLNPELFGKPASKAMTKVRHPARPQAR